MKMKTLPLVKSLPIIILVVSIASISLISACHDQPSQVTPSATMQQKDTTVNKFTAAMVDNKTDPNCGMPVTAGIADTVHYKGKIYGFCSDECKQAFLKNPEVLAKSAQLK
jgi:YHS domain-containing protein